MNNEKSNQQMSKKETLVSGSEFLRECDEELCKMVTQLRFMVTVGELAPAIQHLEEAAYWIRKCKMKHDKHILIMEEEQQ